MSIWLYFLVAVLAVAAVMSAVVAAFCYGVGIGIDATKAALRECVLMRVSDWDDELMAGEPLIVIDTNTGQEAADAATPDLLQPA